MQISPARIVRLGPALGAGLLCGALALGCKPPSARRSAIQGDIGPSTLALRGKLIFDATPTMARSYTGNLLSCGDCHLESGTAPYAAPLIDSAGLFPQYSQRAGHTITLVQRIQECFVRSENGLPPPDTSPEMRALIAYIDWLSRGGVKGVAFQSRGLVQLPALSGNPQAGKKLYARRCAGCHGSNGAGMPPNLPPLWGPGSFSDGAGMSHAAQLAAFIQHNMPQNKPGTLTPQQAYDLAAYIATKPRPKFNKIYQNY